MCSKDNDSYIIDYDEEIVERPKHLSVEFFEEIAENALRTTRLKINKINLSMGSNAGENYCSKIYRVRIEYRLLDGDCVDKRQQLAVIIKSVPVASAAEFLQDLQFYLKEKITYYDVLPRMEVLLPQQRKFGPKLFESLRLPENTLAFEDLAQYGFVMASRESGLNEQHCKLVLERLAEFHAASIVLAEKDPHIFDCYNCGMLARVGLERDNGLLLRYFTGNAHQLRALVSTWPGYERITKKIDKYIGNLRENLIGSQAHIDNEFRVLNHGDLWVNNLLFKYGEANGIAVDSIFLDFQLSVWGSPGIDLNYFFYTSMSLDVLKYKRHGLIKVYHKKLHSTLSDLGLENKAPSLEQVLHEVRSRESFGFFAAYGILPTVSQDKTQTSDNSLDNFADEEFAKKKIEQMFASKRLEETLRYALKYFEDIGVLA